MCPSVCEDTAAVLIREHGEGAALEVAMWADAMLEKGGLDRYAIWKRIVRAVPCDKSLNRDHDAGDDQADLWRRLGARPVHPINGHSQ